MMVFPLGHACLAFGGGFGGGGGWLEHSAFQYTRLLTVYIGRLNQVRQLK